MKEAIKTLLEFQLTEKANYLASENNQYTFRVSGDATSYDIAEAVSNVFDVKVLRVNTLNVKPKLKRDRVRRNKMGRKGGYKKAIVTLKDGDSIQMI